MQIRTHILLFALASIVVVAARGGAVARHNQKSQTEALVNQMLAGERPPDLQKLLEIGPQALPPLLKALSNRHPTLEGAYGILYSWLPRYINRRMPQLLSAQIRRLNAAAWVGQLGPVAKPAVPQLVKILRDDMADANVAHSLALIGPEAREAVPALLVALREQRLFAATALACIGTPETVGPALEAASRNGPALQQREAHSALRKLRARFPGQPFPTPYLGLTEFHHLSASPD